MARDRTWMGASFALSVWHRRTSRWVLAVCLVGLVAGCAQTQIPAAPSTSLAASLDEPLAGEALMRRRVDLERAWQDMVHFQVTMRALVDRNDQRGTGVFDDFILRYMGEHLDPLLQSGWQSSHPELAALDAELRLIKAEMLIDVGAPQRVQHTLDDIFVRFAGREGLLVEHPVGEQSTLLQALEHLEGLGWNRSASGTCEDTASLEACIRAAF